MNRAGFSSVILGVFFTVAGCGRGLQTKAAILQDSTPVPLSFSVSSQYFLTESKRDLYREILDGKNVAFGAITHALIEDHYKNWKERHPDDETELDTMIRGVQGLAAGMPTTGLSETKAALETKLASITGAPLLYNAQAISIFDAIYTNRIQAFSGTLFSTLVLRESWGKAKIDAANLVVIYESGHSLPGYLEPRENGQWNLVGIETTVEGPARVLYGEINHAMQNEDRMMRVVDAQLFALVELFKFNADDIMDMANQALRMTATRYGIVEPSLLVRSSFKRQVNDGQLAWSPFLFGSADVGQGDRPRASLNEASRLSLPRSNPNLTTPYIALPSGSNAPLKGNVFQSGTAASADPYPFRELADSEAEGGRRFQCWDYQKKIWVDIPTKKTEDDRYAIRFHPCKDSTAKYEELPYPLFVEPPKPPPRPYSFPYGGYDDDDWDYDE